MLDAREAEYIARRLDRSFATIIIDVSGDDLVLIARDHTRWPRHGAKCPHSQKVLAENAWHRIVVREDRPFLSGGDLKDFIFYEAILYCYDCEQVIEAIRSRALGA